MNTKYPQRDYNHPEKKTRNIIASLTQLLKTAVSLAYLSNVSEIQLKYAFCIVARFCKPAPLKFWVLQMEFFVDTEHTPEHNLK